MDKQYYLALETIGTCRYYGPFTEIEWATEKVKYPDNFYKIRTFDSMEKAKEALIKLGFKE